MGFFKKKRSNGLNEEILTKLSEWYSEKIKEGLNEGKIKEALLKQFNSETADFVMDFCSKQNEKPKKKVIFVDEVDDIKEYEREKGMKKPSETSNDSEKTNISDLFSDPDEPKK